MGLFKKSKEVRERERKRLKEKLKEIDRERIELVKERDELELEYAQAEKKAMESDVHLKGIINSTIVESTRMDNIPVPTKSDVDEHNQKINELNKLLNHFKIKGMVKGGFEANKHSKRLNEVNQRLREKGLERIETVVQIGKLSLA